MPGLRLVAVIPFRGQESRFPAADRERFRRVLAAADHSVTLSPSYHAGCYAVRNNYLVEHAALLVAWYDGSPGGTHYTVRRALGRGLEFINLPPHSGRPNLRCSDTLPTRGGNALYGGGVPACTFCCHRSTFLPSLSGLLPLPSSFMLPSPPRPFLSAPLSLPAVAARTLAVGIRFPDGLARIAFRFL